MIDGLTLTAVSAVLSATSISTFAGTVSIQITARVLSIDILVADHSRIFLKGLGPGDSRPYSMRLNPIRIEAFNTDPTVQVRAEGLERPVHLSVCVRLTVENLAHRESFIAEHMLDDVNLSPEAPFFAASLPLAVFTTETGDQSPSRRE